MRSMLTVRSAVKACPSQSELHPCLEVAPLICHCSCLIKGRLLAAVRATERGKLIKMAGRAAAPQNPPAADSKSAPAYLRTLAAWQAGNSTMFGNTVLDFVKDHFAAHVGSFYSMPVHNQALHSLHDLLTGISDLSFVEKCPLQHDGGLGSAQLSDRHNAIFFFSVVRCNPSRVVHQSAPDGAKLQSSEVLISPCRLIDATVIAGQKQFLVHDMQNDMQVDSCLLNLASLPYEVLSGLWLWQCSAVSCPFLDMTKLDLSEEQKTLFRAHARTLQLLLTDVLCCRRESEVVCKSLSGPSVVIIFVGKIFFACVHFEL